MRSFLSGILYRDCSHSSFIHVIFSFGEEIGRDNRENEKKVVKKKSP
jgi:hypothetical protein